MPSLEQKRAAHARERESRQGARQKIAYPGAALGVPVGAVIWFFGTTAPHGWLVIDATTIGNASSGADHAGAQFENLFEHIKAVRGTAESWSNGDTITLLDGRARYFYMLGVSDSLEDSEGAAEGSRDPTVPINVSGLSAAEGPAPHMHTYSGNTDSGDSDTPVDSGANSAANSNHGHPYSGTTDSDDAAHGHDIDGSASATIPRFCLNAIIKY